MQQLTQGPSFMQVLHGASNDVLWLQRDFHIYLVNIYLDSAIACQVSSAAPGIVHPMHRILSRIAAGSPVVAVARQQLHENCMALQPSK